MGSLYALKKEFWRTVLIRIILMRIRIRIRGSASGMMDDGTISKFFLNFFCIRFKTMFCCNFELIIRVYQTKLVISLKKKLYFYYFGWFVCEFITIFFVPGSRSTLPDADPDPAKWYGSDRIRNTAEEHKTTPYSHSLVTMDDPFLELQKIPSVITAAFLLSLLQVRKAWAPEDPVSDQGHQHLAQQSLRPDEHRVRRGIRHGKEVSS